MGRYAKSETKRSAKDEAQHKRIKDALALKGENLSTIARELGVDPTSVSLVSRGLVRSVRISNAIAEKLGTTANELWPWRSSYNRLAGE